MKPNRIQTNGTIPNKKKKKSSGYVLAPLPIPPSPPAHWSGLVSVGSNIYNIGGSIYKPLSSVLILDCRSHTWREAPNMRVKRYYPAANVFDGKIYVTGGSEEGNALNWMEVFDPKTQTWEPVLSPLVDRCENHIHKSAVIEGEIFVLGHKGVTYKPKEDRWQAIGGTTFLDLGWVWFAYCVIDNILYCHCMLNGLRWYDPKIGHWMNLKGLKGLPKFADYARVKFADYGGKMAVLWDKYLPSSGYQNKTIWCAVIALERRNSLEMWGKVEWLDAVLTVPKSYEFVAAVSATV